MSINRFEKSRVTSYRDPNAAGAGWWACAAGFAFAFVFAITWLLS